MALVRFVIAASTFFGSRQQEIGSTSAKTGMELNSRMLVAVAVKVLVEVGVKVDVRVFEEVGVFVNVAVFVGVAVLLEGFEELVGDPSFFLAATEHDGDAGGGGRNGPPCLAARRDHRRTADLPA